MRHISILDCTLRDGGYINQWRFGKREIKKIISLLDTAQIDIIECGFLEDTEYDENVSVFSDVAQIAPLISPKRANAMYVAMIALGDIQPEKIAPWDGTSIDGIRLTFHKHEWEEAKRTATALMEKGYQVFIQPVGTTSYTDVELLRLVEAVNELKPFALYLVDTLGILYRKDLLRMFTLADHNLDPKIRLGFHSHNNLQLSFANAQELMRQNTPRQLIIDSSVYGMGRGVGNLATELLAEYINENVEKRYGIMPLLKIANQYLMSIYAQQRWGYALPYFLSAIEGCHPNYADYLMKKETLDIESISKLLRMLPMDQRDLFHKDLIEKMYLAYQEYQIDDAQTIAGLKEIVRGKQILVLAPGASLPAHLEEILTFIREEQPVVISINFCPVRIEPDILFASNRKRLALLQEAMERHPYVLTTSNLQREPSQDVHVVNYSEYLGDGHAADNAGAMLIRILRRAHVGSIALAGFDGFDADSSGNYYIDSYKNPIEKEVADQKNEEIGLQLRTALGDLPYRILTPTRYKL